MNRSLIVNSFSLEALPQQENEGPQSEGRTGKKQLEVINSHESLTQFPKLIKFKQLLHLASTCCRLLGSPLPVALLPLRRYLSLAQKVS